LGVSIQAPALPPQETEDVGPWMQVPPENYPRELS